MSVDTIRIRRASHPIIISTIESQPAPSSWRLLLALLPAVAFIAAILTPGASTLVEAGARAKGIFILNVLSVRRGCSRDHSDAEKEKEAH